MKMQAGVYRFETVHWNCILMIEVYEKMEQMKRNPSAGRREKTFS